MRSFSDVACSGGVREKYRHDRANPPEPIVIPARTGGKESLELVAERVYTFFIHFGELCLIPNFITPGASRNRVAASRVPP